MILLSYATVWSFCRVVKKLRYCPLSPRYISHSVVCCWLLLYIFSLFNSSLSVIYSLKKYLSDFKRIPQTYLTIRHLANGCLSLSAMVLAKRKRGHDRLNSYEDSYLEMVDLFCSLTLTGIFRYFARCFVTS